MFLYAEIIGCGIFSVTMISLFKMVTVAGVITNKRSNSCECNQN